LRHSDLQALFLKLSFVIVQSGNQIFIDIFLSDVFVNWVHISFVFAESVEIFRFSVGIESLQNIALILVISCQKTGF
jgi:hypothetical protein